jgi:hypothetical protein
MGINSWNAETTIFYNIELGIWFFRIYMNKNIQDLHETIAEQKEENESSISRR